MAKCDLSIVLDDPDQVYSGGGTVTGVVRVQVDASVKCTALEVTSVWRTHGRGNVATGTSGSTSLFEGEWQAGENVEYRFELPVADWPPSYHGHYLSIDHYVDARVKIPWGIDPKASVPFRMRPSCGSDGAKLETKATQVSGLVGCIIGVVLLGFVIGFFVMMATAGPFVLFFLIVPLIGSIYWFFRKFLPKYLLGDVHGEFHSDTVSPGQHATGELFICPRKRVPINGVTLHFQAREQCVSGSGSNRTTHKHVFFEKLETLQGATTLMAGQEHRFPLVVHLPDDAPFSVDLDDNDLIWSATLRVDIPRWPDWVKEIPIRVVPSDDQEESVKKQTEADPDVAAVSPESSLDPSSLDPSLSGGGITFRETAEHLWSVRSDREQVDTLVDAVSGLGFQIEADIERRLLYAGDEDPHVYQDGYAVWARYTDPALPLILYVPHELADDFEQVGRGAWQGRGTVVGWDHLHGRLQIKLDRSQ